MIHQPSGGMGGTAADILLQANEILELKRKVNIILSECTGQSVEKIHADSERDFYMSAEDAKNYGLIDEIVQQKKKPSPT
jgi:ATP-dependent Clp protease protease subunit